MPGHESISARGSRVLGTEYEDISAGVLSY